MQLLWKQAHRCTSSCHQITSQPAHFAIQVTMQTPQPALGTSAYNLL
jgi:hypothetical protein